MTHFPLPRRGRVRERHAAWNELLPLPLPVAGDGTSGRHADATTRRRTLHGEEAIIALLAPLAEGVSGRLRPQGRLRADHAGARHRAGAQDRSDGRGRALPRRRRARGHRLEGAGGQRLRSRRQGRPAARLPDGAVVPGGAERRLAFALRRRPGGSAGALRLPPDRRRHGPPARAAHHHHHHHRLGASAAAWCGAARRGRAMRCSSPARSATRRSGWRCARTRRCAAAWGLAPAEAEHLRRPLRPARAAPGAGRRAAQSRLRRHGRLRRPGQGPRPPVRGQRLRRARAACRSAALVRACKSACRRPRARPMQSSPAATTTRCSPPSPQRKTPAVRAASATAAGVTVDADRH